MTNILSIFGEAMDKALSDSPVDQRARIYLDSILVPGFKNWLKRANSAGARYHYGQTNGGEDYSTQITEILKESDNLDKRTLYELSYIAPLHILNPDEAMNILKTVVAGAKASEAIASPGGETAFNGYSIDMFDIVGWVPPGWFYFVREVIKSNGFARRFLDGGKDELRRAATEMCTRMLSDIPVTDTYLRHTPEGAPEMSHDNKVKVIHTVAEINGTTRHRRDFYVNLPEGLRDECLAGLEPSDIINSGLLLKNEALNKAVNDMITSPSTRPEIKLLASAQVRDALVSNDELFRIFVHQVFVPWLSDGNPRLVSVDGSKYPTRTRVFREIMEVGADITTSEYGAPGFAYNDRGSNGYWYYRTVDVRKTDFLHKVLKKAEEEGLVIDQMTEEDWIKL